MSGTVSYDLEGFEAVDDLLHQLSVADRRATRLKAAISLEKSKAKAASRERDEATARADILEAAGFQKPAKWPAPKRQRRGTAVACSMLSDCHWDEVVNLDEMRGVNKYDRRIAELRLRRWADKTIEMARDYTAGVDILGLVVPLGGDLVSGDIHDELKESNEATALETVVHWSAQLAAALSTVADHFGPVHCPTVVGNHGRTTRKPRAKLRVKTNLDWLLVTSTARILEGDTRITFDIPESADCAFEVLGTRFLLTHGDQVTGGGGIGGIWPPIKRLQARKQVNEPHDVLIMGHWHQLVQAATAGLIVNGTNKGADEYSAVSNFPVEPPAQAWWLVTPEHGVTVQAPVFVQDRKAEKW